MTFDGETYEPALDESRLTSQLRRVFRLMSDGEWHSIAEIAEVAHGSENGVSARLRDFRKDRFGGHTVERRRTEKPGVFEYRLVIRKPVTEGIQQDLFGELCR